MNQSQENQSDTKEHVISEQWECYQCSHLPCRVEILTTNDKLPLSCISDKFRDRICLAKNNPNPQWKKVSNFTIGVVDLSLVEENKQLKTEIEKYRNERSSMQSAEVKALRDALEEKCEEIYRLKQNCKWMDDQVKRLLNDLTKFLQEKSSLFGG